MAHATLSDIGLPAVLYLITIVCTFPDTRFRHNHWSGQPTNLLMDKNYDIVASRGRQLRLAIASRSLSAVVGVAVVGHDLFGDTNDAAHRLVRGGRQPGQRGSDQPNEFVVRR